MQEEHEVYYSLSSPLVTFGLPAKYVVTLLMANGSVMVYVGILFSMTSILIICLLNILVMWQIGKKLTKDDPFWFEAIIANLGFFKSINFIKNVLIYKA